jgi:ATP-dependent DNA helicase RecQ
MDGKIVLSEGVRSPSRMLFTTSPSTVYQMRVNDQRLGPLVEALLRLYGGLFEEPAVVDEMRVARYLNWHVDSVVERSMELDRMQVLSYKRRTDAPTVTFIAPREDSGRLQLDPTALRDRRMRAEARLEAMIDYINNTDRCRSTVLLEYFGEKDNNDCGQCDICVNKKRYSSTVNGTMTLNDPLHEHDGDLEFQRWRKDEHGKDDVK